MEVDIYVCQYGCSNSTHPTCLSAVGHCCSPTKMWCLSALFLVVTIECGPSETVWFPGQVRNSLEKLGFWILSPSGNFLSEQVTILWGNPGHTERPCEGALWSIPSEPTCLICEWRYHQMTSSASCLSHFLGSSHPQPQTGEGRDQSVPHRVLTKFLTLRTGSMMEWLWL